MRFKTMLAGAIGLSMAATPVLAQSAAPLSVASAGADYSGQSSQLTGEGYLLPAFAILAVLAAAILVSHQQGNDDNPASP